MNTYDLVVKTRPPVGGDWSAHHTVLDTVPSAMLIADDLTPYFLLTIDAATSAEAMMFATAVCGQMGVTVTSIETEVVTDELPPVAYDFPEAKIAQAWIAKAPELLCA